MERQIARKDAGLQEEKKGAKSITQRAMRV
jgi:hypothetical protein